MSSFHLCFLTDNADVFHPMMLHHFSQRQNMKISRLKKITFYDTFSERCQNVERDTWRI